MLDLMSVVLDRINGVLKVVKRTTYPHRNEVEIVTVCSTKYVATLQHTLNTLPVFGLKEACLPFLEDEHGVYFGYLICRSNGQVLILRIYPNEEMAMEKPNFLPWKRWWNLGGN